MQNCYGPDGESCSQSRDSLNISPRARHCPLGSPRCALGRTRLTRRAEGTAGGLHTRPPGGFENHNDDRENLRRFHVVMFPRCMAARPAAGITRGYVHGPPLRRRAAWAAGGSGRRRGLRSGGPGLPDRRPGLGGPPRRITQSSH